MITDFLVIGGGIAGLSFALEASKYGEVTVLIKSKWYDTSSALAQGGISCVQLKEDSFESHIEDTLKAGHYLSDREAVEVLVHEAPAAIKRLESFGLKFDRLDNHYDLSREGGHSYHRILHVEDATGLAMQQVLVQHVQHTSNIKIIEKAFIFKLIVEQNECLGANYFDRKGNAKQIFANATLTATGGGSQIYSFTTNPKAATGDGYALGALAGAKTKHMGYIQFHPSALYESKPENRLTLVTEAFRGEGAMLFTENSGYFMKKYHPMGDLAPRDVVSKAIFQEMQNNKVSHVFLDPGPVPSLKIQKKFPNLLKVTREKLGIDILAGDKIPVVPAAHFFCGGIKTNLNGQTTVNRLFAAGETACTDVHGANRLASNGLLEGLVFSVRAAQAAGKLTPVSGFSSSLNIAPVEVYTEISRDYRNRVKKLMWENAGIVSSKEQLKSAENELNKIRKSVTNCSSLNDYEVLNMIETSLLVIKDRLRMA